jgi:hypothetical protein
MKIISGGQTGVDRAALDVALRHGIAAGGWCPDARLAEDGAIPDKYPVRVLAGAGYRERTWQNVIDSDATVVVYFGRPAGGTRDTIKFCMAANKPCMLIDAGKLKCEAAADNICRFIDETSASVINFAGPRASEAAAAYPYAKHLITQLLVRLRQRPVLPA